MTIKGRLLSQGRSRGERYGENESSRVHPAGARRGREGHVAEPQGDHDHHRDGVRDGRGGKPILSRERSDHARGRQPDPRAWVLGATTMTKRWYIVHAYSNFENKVAQSLRDQAAQRGLTEKFDEILVPTEKVVEVRRGRKVDAERKL